MNQTPHNIKLHQRSRVLEVEYETDTFMLPCEYLRVYSPSAEVQGHGPGQEVLQTHKEQVNIVAIEPVGNYAIKLIYSDAHNSGLYSWDYLYELGTTVQQKWPDYLKQLSENGIHREQQAHDKYLLDTNNPLTT